MSLSVFPLPLCGRLLLAASLCLWLLCGCQQQPERVLLQEHVLEDSVALAGNDGPVCRAMLRIVTLSPAEPRNAGRAEPPTQASQPGISPAERINEYILTQLLGQPVGVSTEEALDGCMDDYLREFTHIVREMYYEDLAYEEQSDSAEADAPPSSLGLKARYSFDYRTEASAQTGRGDSVVCYRLSTYRYMGGAHGMSNQRWVTFSLRSGRPVTWQQLFGEGAADLLCRLLTRKLMEQEGVESEEALHELGFLDLGDMFVSDDMLMESDRIVFHYDPYELAPYVLGDIDIAFSYKEIEHYMDAGG